MRAVKYFTSIGMLLGLMMAPEAWAANLAIDDTVAGKLTLSHDANWEFGVTSNGTPFGNRVSGNTMTVGETATFSGSWIVNSAGIPDPGAGIIYFVQSDRPDRVSDIIKASWTTTTGTATISLAIQSSSSGGDLGALPAAFAGAGIVENGSLVGIEGSFRDSTTGAPVTIPSNLTIQFGSDADLLRAPAPVLSHAALGVAGLLLLGGGVWLTRRRPAGLNT